MLPPAPPLIFFEWEDPTLDPNAITHGALPERRVLPGVLSIALATLIAFGLQYALRHCPEGMSPRTWVPVVLTQEFQEKPLGTLRPEPRFGPSGGGQRGNGARPPDTGLEDLAARPLPARELQQEVLPIPLAQNPSLPVAPGGNGRTRGWGWGSGGGTGGGHGSGNGMDGQLIPVNRPVLAYDLQPGEYTEACIIAVEAVVELNGQVSRARMVSGPAFLKQHAELCAMKWTFEPLAPHGLTTPARITIRFHYEP